MQIIILKNAEWEYMWEPENGVNMLKDLEKVGRTCYKSENKITENSYEKFIKMITCNSHLSVIEHKSVTVKIICDRATSHQLVRHRLGSYSQQSQRYVNYNKKGGIIFIRPHDLKEGTLEYDTWKESLDHAVTAYDALILKGVKPEAARSILPNCTATEIVCTFNLRQWKHVFAERALNLGAQKDIRILFGSILKDFKERIPIVFDEEWIRYKSMLSEEL